MHSVRRGRWYEAVGQGPSACEQAHDDHGWSASDAQLPLPSPSAEFAIPSAAAASNGAETPRQRRPGER